MNVNFQHPCPKYITLRILLVVSVSSFFSPVLREYLNTLYFQRIKKIKAIKK